MRPREPGSGVGGVPGRNSPASLEVGNVKSIGATTGTLDVRSVTANRPLSIFHPKRRPGSKDKPVMSTEFPNTVKSILVESIVTVGSDAQGPRHSTVYVPYGVTSACALGAAMATNSIASIVHNDFGILPTFPAAS